MQDIEDHEFLEMVLTKTISHVSIVHGVHFFFQFYPFCAISHKLKVKIKSDCFSSNFFGTRA